MKKEFVGYNYQHSIRIAIGLFIVLFSLHLLRDAIAGNIVEGLQESFIFSFGAAICMSLLYLFFDPTYRIYLNPKKVEGFLKEKENGLWDKLISGEKVVIPSTFGDNADLILYKEEGEIVAEGSKFRISNIQ